VSDREQRLIENQRMIRSANFRAARELEHLLLDPAKRSEQKLELFCACGHPMCDARLTITLDEYERLHTKPNRFVVVPGHENPGVEHVVFHGDGFDVVEKHAG
jgi:hypothetical protein